MRSYFQRGSVHPWHGRWAAPAAARAPCSAPCATGSPSSSDASAGLSGISPPALYTLSLGSDACLRLPALGLSLWDVPAGFLHPPCTWSLQTSPEPRGAERQGLDPAPLAPSRCIAPAGLDALKSEVCCTTCVYTARSAVYCNKII